MASRPLIKPAKVIINGDMSADITSEVTICTNVTMVSYAFSWTGTAPIGRIIIEVSNDYSQNEQGEVKNPGTWNELPLSEPAAVSGDSDAGFIDIYAIGAYAMRARYVRASGTGVLQATAVAKVM